MWVVGKMKKTFNKNQTLNDIQSFLRDQDAFITNTVISSDGTTILYYELNKEVTGK